jgi:ABC-type oligopeptide transport system ATPase subunit
VCDEPVSALDVSVGGQIVNLLAQLQRNFGLTYLFISHSMPVVRYLSTRIAVMYHGKLVEINSTDQIVENPEHPYTKTLLEATPEIVV